jgi:hypothetical protein
MIRRTVMLALALLAIPAALAHASPDQIYADCQDGRLDKGYSQSDYRKALAGMPGDLDEYTNCRELIRSAMSGVRGGGGSGPGGAGRGGYGALPAGQGGLSLGPDSRPVDPSKIASKDEQAALNLARKGQGLSDSTGTLVPRTAALRPDSHSSSLPAPLIVLLALTAAAALVALVPRLRDLVLRRPAA